MIAEAFGVAMQQEQGRTVGLGDHPHLPMYATNLGDRPGLFVDVPLPAGSAVEDGKGFEVLVVSRGGRSGVLIRPTRAGGASFEFIALAEFIYRETSVATSRSAAIASLVDCVHEFRQFFARRDDRLSEEAVRGLFAELEFLMALSDAGLPPVDLLNAWSGPYGSTDFKFVDGVAVEVKTTHVPPRKAKISSEYQLETPDGSLTLMVRPLTTVAPNDLAGVSFVELVAKVKALLAGSPGANAQWHSAVTAIGLDDQDAYYEQWRFKADDWLAFGVTDGFPRIVPTDLPSGISGVSYSVVLEFAEPFAVDRTTLIEDIVKRYG